MRVLRGTIMSSGSDFRVIRRRTSPTRLEKLRLWIKFYSLWRIKNFYARTSTVVKMLLKREKRLYYMYSTGEVVTVTAFNYSKLVKVDGDEYALIKFKTKTGVVYAKGERF